MDDITRMTRVSDLMSLMYLSMLQELGETAFATSMLASLAVTRDRTERMRLDCELSDMVVQYRTGGKITITAQEMRVAAERILDNVDPTRHAIEAIAYGARLVKSTSA